MCLGGFPEVHDLTEAGERRQASRHDDLDASLYHFRAQHGLEADVVIEAPDGRVVAICDQVLALGDRLVALPLASLWTPQ